MSTKNCPNCGKLFDQKGFYEVCHSCFEQNESDFDTVRSYLYSYPNKNILEVSGATGVPIERIREYIRQGRLTSTS